MTKNIYIESLLSLGGKKRKGSIDFVADNLLIRHKDSRIEYTVKKIIKDEDGNPVVLCYRYYAPDRNSKKVFVKIPKSDFNKYEPVWDNNGIFNK